MKISIKILALVCINILLIFGCKIEPKPINFGKDNCSFCNMTIVDKLHASEYVTKKGKSYKFDAIECMVLDIHKKKHQNKLKYLLVADYGNSGKFIDAKKAIFLISEKIKSPMGANLSAFSTKEKSSLAQKDFGGILLDWEKLKKELTKNN